MLARWRDLSTALVLLLFCVLIFLESGRFEEVPAAFAQGMQADAFPRLIALTIAALAIVLLIQGRGKPEPDREPIRLRVFGTGAILLAATALMGPLGVTLAAVFSCLAIPLAWGERKIFRLGLFAIGFPLLLYFIFSVLLQLRLPQGPLQGIL